MEYSNPNEINHTPELQGASETPEIQIPDLPETAPVSRKENKRIRRLLAAAAALAVVVSACGITAWSVNRRWEEETARMQSEFETRLSQVQAQLQSQIDAQTPNGTGSASGVTSVVPQTGGLTPAQVYAQNVNSVVAVSNFVADSRRGQEGTMLQGMGSGFFISGDGYIITNYHVIENADKLTITTHGGEEYEAQLIGSDEINDIALLKVEAQGIKPAVIGSSDALLVGDMVVAIGNPLGELTATATVGYVSGKDRSVSTDGTIINMLQTDAAINSGNSGGPLFNMQGQVIGITTAKYSGSSASGASIEGIGFAIPINDVLHMIDDFKEYGYLRNQAYLGVTVLNLGQDTATLYSLPTGSYVQGMVKGGCAEKAGIQPADIIIAIGEFPVDGNAALTSTLRRFHAGDTTTVTVYRAGQELTLTITFDERPQNAGLEDSRPLEENEMPENGSYDEWYDYFDRHFGLPERP